VVVILCAGCIPYRFSPRPGVSGHVVDGGTGRQLADAEVEIKPTRTGEAVVKTHTSLDGTFQIRPRRQWGVYLVPGDVFS